MSNLQTITDGASESIEGLDGLLPSGERPGERTCEEERRWRRERVAGALRLLARFGMNDGAAGHITARDPEDPDTFWVNPALKNFATMCVSDLLLIDADGGVREGDGPLNRAAFAIRSRLHQARPDVVAAAHAHSTYGKNSVARAGPASCSGERQFGRTSADDQTGQVGSSLTRMESSSPSTATSPNLRRGGFTDVHKASGEAVPTCTFDLADLTFWFDS